MTFTKFTPRAYWAEAAISSPIVGLSQRKLLDIVHVVSAFIKLIINLVPRSCVRATLNDLGKRISNHIDTVVDRIQRMIQGISI